MPDDHRDLADLERRLDEGVWLTVPEVRRLFGVRSNSTIHRWVDKGLIGYRQGPQPQRARKVLDPDDVRRLLDEWRQERRGPHRVTPESGTGGDR